MAKFDLREYARDGAKARAAELEAELSRIYGAFPELRGAGARREGAKTRRRTGRRKPMTAAQKKAVSMRMKKYWAARRKSA